MNNLPERAIELIDNHAGVFIPQEFAEVFCAAIAPETVSDGDMTILAAGPDEEWYWDTWDHVLANAVLIGKDGARYTLYQDGDLWAIPEDAEWPED